VSAGAIPGIRGAEHIAFSVPDLDQAIAFFCDVIGCEYFYSIGPFRDPEGTWFQDNFRLHPRAEVTRACLLRCGYGPNFEIFEFTAPEQRHEMPRMSDWGGTHLAFYVDDMDAAVAYLAEHEIEVLGGKKPAMEAESGEDSTFGHFYTPWGMMLELVSFPHGKTYMDGRDRVLWQPHHPEL
jgi:catechol 2,3-dioxygenase-like lactoylglutathione lyase family enzyme